MKAQQHFDEAVRLLDEAWTSTSDDRLVAIKLEMAQVHATLAMAGFTRDANRMANIREAR